MSYIITHPFTGAPVHVHTLINKALLCATIISTLLPLPLLSQHHVSILSVHHLHGPQIFIFKTPHSPRGGACSSGGGVFLGPAPEYHLLLLEVPAVVLVHQNQIQEVFDGENIVHRSGHTVDACMHM